MTLSPRRGVAALTAPLDAPLNSGPEREAWQYQTRALGLILGLFALGALLWSTLAPLSGAIIAPGLVKTELNRKVIQHQEGGIVGAILVREGQRVSEGQALVEIGDAQISATSTILKDRLASESLRRARLQAELALAPRFSAAGLDGDAGREDEYLARERALFLAQRQALDQQEAVLEAQIRETRSQIRALESQTVATGNSLEKAREEFEINSKLVRDGFIQRTKVLALERVVSDYESNLGEFQSNLAQARQRIEDYRLRIVQARNQYRQQAAAEMRETVIRIDEILEQQRASADQMRRQVVRSPVDGTVMALRVTALGQAIGPREPILEVVPLREKLMVEARVNPDDIEHVSPGKGAEVRLTAYDFRSTQMLKGRVVTVSADRITDQRTDSGFYLIQVEVNLDKLEALSSTGMQSGMAAEVFITTPARTLAEYLIRPLVESARRGMREP